MEKHKWHRIKALRYMLNDGSESVLFPALAYGNTGLGVSRAIVAQSTHNWAQGDVWTQGDEWRSIHVPLGVALGPRFKTQKQAKLHVESVASLVDWHKVTVENSKALGISNAVNLRANLIREHGELWHIELTVQRLIGGDSNAS